MDTLQTPQTPPEPTVNTGGNQVINIAGDTVTLATADYPDTHRTWVRRLYHFVKDQAWSWAEVEAHTKISTTVLYRIWKGQYRNPSTGDPIDLSATCEKIERFFTLWEARAPEAKLPYIETSVWKRVNKVCSEALQMQTIAFIYGEPQIGKTAALREYARRNNHGQCVYTLMPASAGVQSMMKSIAEACHIGVNTCFEGLRTRVGKYFDDTKLLIVDEVHECFVSYQKGSMLKCLAILRQLQERSGCGMVLCGTNVFRDELERGEFKQAMRQLRLRGIWELQLESVPTQSDLKLISDHYRLPEPTGDAADLVKWIAHQMGLGKYVKFLHRAATYAIGRKEKMTWAHFQKVVSHADALSKMPEAKWN